MRGRGELPAVGLADDEAGGFEAVEGVGDGLLAGADGGTELFEAAMAIVEGGEDALLSGVFSGGWLQPPRGGGT